MIIKAHTSIIGDTGYNCHSRNFFKALHKKIPVQVRNFTVGSSWGGYDNDQPHDKEYYIDDVLKQMLVEQTLTTPNGREEFPLYTRYKNGGEPDVHIVLNETDHHYFYDDYDGKKIAYNVWETTRQPEEFFERLKTFDQVWVPSEWQRQCTIEQGIPAHKVKVVPEGVDVKTYKPKNYVVSKPVSRPFRFLLVGRWDYRKATKEIIETFCKTFSEDEDVELMLSVDNAFATDGLNSTEERLDKYGIKHSKIKVVHHLNKDEYVNMLKNSDVFISCARGEGWNLPLIEAMSCGVPSLYSNWGAQLEFAKGRGIPVDVTGEVPASANGKDYYSWFKDASGNFVEPNFNDLSNKMRDVFENYTVYKKKALDESDEIREIFAWDNAATIAKNTLTEFMTEIKHDDDSVAVVLAHANTPLRKKLLKECLLSLKMDTILSTNYPVDTETQNMVKWFVYSKENPLLYPHEYEKLGVNYITWWRDKDNKYFEKPFDYEHSYAVYDLTKRGIELAKLLGKKKIHIINYDYTISQNTLINHENLLNDYDFVVYEYDDKKHGESAYCSAFMSGKVDAMYDYFGKHSTKEEYYTSLGGFNILEMNLSEYLKKTTFKIKEMKMSSLLGENKLNQADANNYNQLETLEFVDKSFKEISDYFDCDKTTYHKYDKHYPMFFEKWRNDSINIFEIGLDEGKSMNVWQNYFPFAKIWGMDISKSIKSARCNVFVGDQSKIEDLRRVSNQVPKCKIIVDDGSHVAEHQLKSFYYLFQNMLDWGGVYVIEDTECSYWAPDKDVYSFETGYLNLIDYFTKLNHEVNNHYNGTKDKLHIKSITYGENCIIIEKKENNEVVDRNYRFKDRLGSEPNYKETHNEVSKPNQININFIDQPFVEIVGKDERDYVVRFIDNDKDKLVYFSNLKNNQWAKCNRRWFTNWKIEIESSDGKKFTHTMDLKDKRVFIIFESSSLGDTIAWIPYVAEFRKKHGCHVIVSTFQNSLFEEQYTELEFVEPGTSVTDLYALYRLGVFYDDTGVDTTKHRTDFRKLRLQEYASDILGLDFEEITPKMKSLEPNKANKPYICIANHSTAQSKYWNNPNGWQELVDYVKGLGFDVYLLSKEDDGYMGNVNPKGVIKISNKSLEEIGSILLGSTGFVGISSGLSWLAWALNVPTILISGQTDKSLEPSSNIKRIINENVCHACFSRHLFDRSDWNWCPDQGGTERQFECSKTITFDEVKPKLDEILNI